MKINKTNAARLLDKAKITYELIPYEVDEKDLSAVHVAASLGENIEQVFKTLVLHGDNLLLPSVCVYSREHTSSPSYNPIVREIGFPCKLQGILRLPFY